MSHTKIKTFEAACKALKLDPKKIIPDFSAYPNKEHRDGMIAHAKLVIIAQALNDGWKPDWKNGKWDKYYPWFPIRFIPLLSNVTFHLSGTCAIHF